MRTAKIVVIGLTGVYSTMFLVPLFVCVYAKINGTVIFTISR